VCLSRYSFALAFFTKTIVTQQLIVDCQSGWGRILKSPRIISATSSFSLKFLCILCASASFEEATKKNFRAGRKGPREKACGAAAPVPAIYSSLAPFVAWWANCSSQASPCWTLEKPVNSKEAFPAAPNSRRAW